MAVWHATHTHLYPGARLRADTAAPRAGALTVEFADLASAPARLAGGAGRWRLHVAAHRTQRGAAIAAKVWHVEPLPPPEPPGRSEGEYRSAQARRHPNEPAGTWRVMRRADE